MDTRTPARTVRLTAAQALVRFLSVQHSERDGTSRRLVPAMLGIFGHGNVAGLGQAIDQDGAQLPYLQARNEQSMVHLAAAFAKENRRLATLACTSSIGPGATNMVTGAALATISRLPVLLLPGDLYASRRQGPVLQQLEHPLAADLSVNDCFRPVARFFDRITRPGQLITALPEAMRVLANPSETGAVVLALPQDVQAEAYDYPEALFAPRAWPVARPRPEPGPVAAAAALLAAARRPLLIAGGGVRYSEAEAELAALATEAAIPVAETFGGKGAVTDPAWWALGGLGLEGNPAANRYAATADVVVCVGTRLTDFTTASQSLFQHPEVRFVGVNVSAHDAHKQAALAIVADAREALAALRAALASISRATTGHQDLRQEVEALTGAWQAERAAALAPPAEDEGEDRTLTQGQLIGVLQEEAEPGDVILTAAGGPPGDLLKVWDATGGRDCHLEFGYSCMGYELPATLGVRLARGDGRGQVVGLIGDGTFLMQPSELVTAVQEGLAVTIVISENHGFQCIRRLQMNRVGVPFGNEFRARKGPRDGAGGFGGLKSEALATASGDPGGPSGSPPMRQGLLEGDYLQLDLAAVARGLGARAWHADGAAELRAALQEARGHDGPSVIVVETVPRHDLPPSGAWWDVAPAEVSDEPATQRLRAEYEADRARLQRSYL
jgi:3D-(3,5/4)-trihydroxycyclohexane-1,2-dione acylhydrolase (decyclizing)